MSIYDVKTRRSLRRNDRGGGPAEVIQLLYKVVGRGTQLMADLKPGDKVGLLAPLGHGFFKEDYLPRAKEVEGILHVAGGIGIAALLLPARELAKAGFRQRLFFGGRTKGDLVGVRDFKPLVRETVLATEEGSVGHRGFVTKPLEEFLARHPNGKYLLMVCGPWPMLRAAVELAKRYDHACMASMENRMGCGLGVRPGLLGREGYLGSREHSQDLRGKSRGKGQERTAFTAQRRIRMIAKSKSKPARNRKAGTPHRFEPRIDTTIAGVHFQNPVLTASGTFGYGQEFAHLIDLNRLGGIVVKGISAEPMAGNPPPRIYETESC
jgi:NAD(P)H-flavin reductase